MDLVPIYRIEFFLDAIVNNTTPPDPIYRAEFYLAKIAGANVEIPEPVYRMDKYLAYLCGEEVELPDPIYRIEYYLAFLCGLNVELPEPIYRVEFWLWDWCGGGGIEKTVTGNPIHILDALAKPAQALSVKLEPVQDLHGYDNPWPAGGSYNLLPNNATSQTVNNVQYTVNADGSIKANGTSNGWTGLAVGTVTLPAGTYYLRSGVTTDYAKLYLEATINGTNYSTNSSPSKQIVLTAEATFVVKLFVPSGQTASNLVCYPMIIADGSSLDYIPNANICPISGWTEATVTRTGKNLLNPEDLTLIVYNSYVSTPKYSSVGKIQVKPNTEYTISFGVIPSYSADARVFGFNSSGERTLLANSFEGSASFTTQADTELISFYYKTGQTLTTPTDAEPQLELGTTATAYEPYNGNTYSVDWTTPAGTVYGGTLDVTTGKMVVDRAMVDLGTLAWGYESSSAQFYSNGISGTSINWNNWNNTPPLVCSRYKPIANSQLASSDFCVGYAYNSKQLRVKDSTYTDAATFKSAMSGQTIVYPLATPIVYDLTPTEVTTLLGTNNVWSDGEMTLVYLADGNASDVEALNILLGNRYVNNHGEDEPTDREALQILLGGNR